ncbi:WSC domain-containing protein 2 [Cladobotryum mycophilum]|uniref:WSC domain-containing protein 2 n=1 Tax=Cladobotryum mycophilum TaxID=491253 RepID=A0ABR0SGF9_9HYPO
MRHLVTLLWPLALLLALACAQQSANVTIWKGSKKYHYYGCYNETTQISGSAETRALEGGINEVKQGQMTVPLCLAYCSEGTTEYRYAGLEWSRECWCSQSISGIAEKLDDAACNYACEGDNTTACGGSLKLSIYRISAASGLSAPTLLIVSGVVLALVL